MPVNKQLSAVTPRPGQPLYQTVKDALCGAIDAGVFAPGEQMPNTKQLSEQLGVSLVTAHRALQELVLSGVLERSQGRGTFVHHRHQERRKIAATVRVGLVFNTDASLADFQHSQILDGVHQAADTDGIDLILLRFGEDVRNECDGYLFVNPQPTDIDKIAANLRRGQRALIVGAQSGNAQLPSFDVDNVEVAKLAVKHLADLGHKHIGYVSGAQTSPRCRDRWQGFVGACEQLSLACPERYMVRGSGARLQQSELIALADMLNKGDRPTALFAAGHLLALDVYAVAGILNVQIPEQISVVGVDDPPGAVHLAPPMTTLRRPLVEMGREAVRALANHVQHGAELRCRRFMPELMIRGSTAGPPADPKSTSVQVS